MPSGSKRSKKTIEFGDFQTPMALARSVCGVVATRELSPASVLEPTCGLGNLLVAALERFPTIGSALGVDINPSYVRRAQAAITEKQFAGKASFVCGNLFDLDWPMLLRELPDPLLVIGNPPWVTNARLSALGSGNLPQKSNFHERRGLDAITGKANFDISEWMLVRFLDWLNGRRALLALLCKAAVARKALSYAWKRGFTMTNSEMYLIDAEECFGASVEACLLVCELGPSRGGQDARVFSSLQGEKERAVLGYRDGRLIADVQGYDRWRHLRGSRSLRWRSGIKHDCSKVMELTREGNKYRNGLAELVDLEEAHLYPMLKGSEIAKARVQAPKRWMLVTQQSIGQETQTIETSAPKTWRYLQSHGERLDRRGSSVYAKQPRFSVFGVGSYTFAPWKVAIAGFCKELDFAVIGRAAGKPIVLDDTCYFVPCNTREDAEFLASLLNSEQSRAFFSALVFWDAKRPITVEILGQLDLVALTTEVGAELGRVDKLLGRSPECDVGDRLTQQELFPAHQ
jgi:hypothetical protein